MPLEGVRIRPEHLFGRADDAASGEGLHMAGDVVVGGELLGDKYGVRTKISFKSCQQYQEYP